MVSTWNTTLHLGDDAFRRELFEWKLENKQGKMKPKARKTGKEIDGEEADYWEVCSVRARSQN